MGGRVTRYDQTFPWPVLPSIESLTPTSHPPAFPFPRIRLLPIKPASQGARPGRTHNCDLPRDPLSIPWQPKPRMLFYFSPTGCKSPDSTPTATQANPAHTRDSPAPRNPDAPASRRFAPRQTRIHTACVSPKRIDPYTPPRKRRVGFCAAYGWAGGCGRR
jgi:hypothetical protein